MDAELGNHWRGVLPCAFLGMYITPFRCSTEWAWSCSQRVAAVAVSSPAGPGLAYNCRYLHKENEMWVILALIPVRLTTLYVPATPQCSKHEQEATQHTHKSVQTQRGMAGVTLTDGREGPVRLTRQNW